MCVIFGLFGEESVSSTTANFSPSSFKVRFQSVSCCYIHVAESGCDGDNSSGTASGVDGLELKVESTGVCDVVNDAEAGVYGVVLVLTLMVLVMLLMIRMPMIAPM